MEKGVDKGEPLRTVLRHIMAVLKSYARIVTFGFAMRLRET